MSKSLISKEKLNKILQYRESLQAQLKHYREALECEHIYGNIEMSSDYWTEATCPKCGEGYAITFSGDGSCMSYEHQSKENERKKTEEEIQHFRDYLNETIGAKIKRIDYTLAEMRIFILQRRFLRKPKLIILGFEGGVVGYDMFDHTLHIDSGKSGRCQHFFFDGNFLLRDSSICSYKPDEWTDIKNE